MTRSHGLCLLAALALALPVRAQSGQQGQKGPLPTESTQGLSEYQSEMLAIEREKIGLEREKQKLERDKFDDQRSPVSRYGPVASVLAALAAILAGILNANKQARVQARLANQQAQVQARLKAVEVVISASGPESAKERLRIVESLLGERFEASVEGNLSGVGPGHDENRKLMIGMVVDNPGKERLIVELWDAAFGGRNLGKDIERFGGMLGVATPVSTARQAELAREAKEKKAKAVEEAAA